MLSLLHLLLLASAVASGAQGHAPRSQPTAVSEAGERHGKVKWFEGTYDALLAKAKSEQRVVLLNFYTDLCRYCLDLDREGYSDKGVIEALTPVLCFSVDAESELGKPLDERFPTESYYPALIFLDPDGSLRDRIVGYMPTRQLLPEIQRILNDVGTLGDLRRKVAAQPEDLAAIWNLAVKLEELGDQAACEREVEHIKALDPEGKSLPMHQMAMRAALHQANETGDDEPLRKLLATETYPELLFQGWNRLAISELWRAKRAGMQGLTELAQRARTAYHEAHLQAWPYCPTEMTARYGNLVAWELYRDWSALDKEMRSAAIGIARQAVAAAPTTAEVLDTLACLLFNDGQIDEAVRLMRDCIRLEPDRDLWEERLEMFQAKES